MLRRKQLVYSVLLVCVALFVFLETARRSWTLHSWLSVAAHGHVFHRVVYTAELPGRIPEHYPVHTLESQRLVYSGDQYLGYQSKHGFFVPVAMTWDSAAVQASRLTAGLYMLSLLFGLLGVVIAVLLLLSRETGQPDAPATAG